ncbi:MAG: 3'-5' exonuclease [Gammaproteobacteria bacterium]|nr:3'-5' exonuclease [Gammaproteobacteria bacterium]
MDYLLNYVPSKKIHLGWLDNPKTWVGSRLDAIVWAKRLLKSDAVIMDTETTGLLDKSNVEVIELAAINMKGKPVYHGIFKPKYKIPVKVIKIHHITNERVESAPAFSDKWKHINSTLRGRVIVTYNAEFDRIVLARTCQLHKVEMFDARWECAMWAYKYFLETGSFRKLGGEHRALADCRATLRLIQRMASSIPY